MVNRIANDVNKGILDRLDDSAIQFGRLPLHDQFNLFAQFLGHIPHNSRQLGPDVTDRLHPGLHHAFLKLGRDDVQTLRRLDKGCVFGLRGEFNNLIAGQHQLTHQVHQLVELDDIHANGAFRNPGFAGWRSGRGSFGNRGNLCGRGR